METVPYVPNTTLMLEELRRRCAIYGWKITDLAEEPDTEPPIVPAAWITGTIEPYHFLLVYNYDDGHYWGEIVNHVQDTGDTYYSGDTAEKIAERGLLSNRMYHAIMCFLKGEPPSECGGNVEG
jgi:hypothetical protein